MNLFTGSRGQRRPRLLRTLVLSTVLATCGAVLAAPAGAGPTSPDEALEDLASFLEKARSVDLTAPLEIGGAPIGTLELSAVFPKRGRNLLDFGGLLTETIYTPKARYDRFTESSGVPPLEEAEWNRSVDLPEPLLFDNPLELRDLADELTADSFDGTTLHTTFKDPAKVTRPPGTDPWTAATLDITLTDGEPTAFVLTASGPIGTAGARVDEIAWNEPVTIQVPKRSEVINKKAVGAYKDAKLLQPAALPDGFELVGASVVVAARTQEACDEVLLVWADLDTKKVISIFEFPASCANPALPEGGQPFTAGANSGRIQELPNFANAQFDDIEGTAVQIGTNLSRSDLETIASDLVPLNFKKPPKQGL